MYFFSSLIYFRFRYTFSLKPYDLNLTMVDCFPSLVGPSWWHLSNSMSTSSSEKFRYLTITCLAFLVISLVVSCSLRVMLPSITDSLLWHWWRSSTSCDNSLLTFSVIISSILSSPTVSSNLKGLMLLPLLGVLAIDWFAD